MVTIPTANLLFASSLIHSDHSAIDAQSILLSAGNCTRKRLRHGKAGDVAVLPDTVIVAVLDTGLEKRIDSRLASVITVIVDAVNSLLVRACSSAVKIHSTSEGICKLVGFAGHRERIAIHK